MNKQERDESRKICEAATKGPWYQHRNNKQMVCAKSLKPRTDTDFHPNPIVFQTGLYCLARDKMHENAAFCVHARTALPKALDRINELEEVVVTELKDAVSAMGCQKERADKLEAENRRLESLINTPQTENFIEAVKNEAAHQIERWGPDHDKDKEDSDWLWLVAYVCTKAFKDPDKKLHHIITTAAVCLNWHKHAMALEAKKGAE